MRSPDVDDATTPICKNKVTTGLDLGDRCTQVCVLDSDGRVVEEARLRTTPADLRRRFAGRACGRAASSARRERGQADRCVLRCTALCCLPSLFRDRCGWQTPYATSREETAPAWAKPEGPSRDSAPGRKGEPVVLPDAFYPLVVHGKAFLAQFGVHPLITPPGLLLADLLDAFHRFHIVGPSRLVVE